MSTNPETPQPGGTPTAWQRFTTFEPVLLRGILAAVAVVLLTVGIDASDVFERVNLAWAAVFAVIPLVQAWWTRGKTTATAAVLEQTTPEGVVIAGPANAVVPEGDVIRVLGDAPDTPTEPGPYDHWSR